MEIRLLDVAEQELDEAIEYYNAESLVSVMSFCWKCSQPLTESSNFLKRGIHPLRIAAVVRREDSVRDRLSDFRN